MNEDVYFPIRNNLINFESRSEQPGLETRIKQSILLYDNLVFDYGVYGLLCNENGSFDFFDYNPQDISNVDYEIDDRFENFKLVGKFPDGTEIPMIEPGRGKFYRSSFLPLLNDLGILNEDFIKFISYDLTEDGKKVLQKDVSESEKYMDLLNVPSTCKSKIFENFHKSTIVSKSLNIPIMTDDLHNSLAQKISQESLKKDNRLQVLDNVLNTADSYINCEIPDFSLFDIDTIIDYRNDKLFKNFRLKILDLNNAVTEQDENKLKEIVMGEVIQELSNQMEELAPSAPKLVLRVFTGILGCIPGVSELISIGNVTGDVISSYKSLKNYENSWLAFILNYQG